MKKMRGHSRVRFHAECTVIQSRRIRRDQLSECGRDRPRFVHEGVSKAPQVNRHLRTESEEMPNLPVFTSLCLSRFDHVEMRTWPPAGFNVCKIDGRDGC